METGADMMTNEPAGMIEIECERCTGVGKLGHYMHVEGGVCFLCGGRKVRMVKASELVVVASKPDSRKRVALEGFDGAWIGRFGAGFRVDVVIAEDDDMAHDGYRLDELPAWFEVRNGQIVDVIVCDGLRARGIKADKIRTALQAALKVRS